MGVRKEKGILPDPKSWEEEMAQPDWKERVKASQEECRNSEKHGVF